MTPPRVALLVNPAAGRGAAARAAGPVRRALDTAGLTVVPVVGDSAEESRAALRGLVAADGPAPAAAATGVDAVVAVGGDGTASLAVDATAGTGVPLGLVPAGTGDDLAAALGLAPGDPGAAATALAAALLEGRHRAVDAVRVTGGGVGVRWYGNVLGAGFDSAVTERANRLSWPRNRLRYDLAVLAELRVFRPAAFRLELDGDAWETEAMLVAVGNGHRYGAGMRICPDARPDDGLLDVTVVLPVSTARFVGVFPRVYRGTHTDHPAVVTRRARTVALAAAGQVAYADGERLGPLPVTAECVPGALRVLGD